MFLFSAGSIVLTGCTTGDPLIPTAIYQSANENDRVWAYKATWQDTRALNEALERGDMSAVEDIAPLLTARLQRLEQGKATPMSDSRTATFVTKIKADLNDKDYEESLRRLTELGKRIQVDFDAGDFAAARVGAIEALVTARFLAEGL
jgi:hypothetical protein